MFGTNPVRKRQEDDGNRLWVQEIFYTLQGEGPFSGECSVFVRLAGCNLRCFWCDTDFESSRWVAGLDEILERIEAIRPAHCSLIVLTGGEPLRQNIVPLVTRLLEGGRRVQIETNGTLWRDLPTHDSLTIICSPKTPKLDHRLVARVHAFKYVLAADAIDAEDGLPSRSALERDLPCRLFRPPPGRPVFVSPCDEAGRTQANTAAAAASALRHGYRLSLQVHKVVSLP